MKKRIKVTIETDRVFIIRRHGGSVIAWCNGCGKQVKMIAPDEAAALAHVSSRTIYRWVEAEKIHFTETATGHLFICFNSLFC